MNATLPIVRAPHDGVVVRSVVLASGDEGLRQRLRDSLTDMRWTVREAAGGAEAMAMVEEERPEALLVDTWLPDLEVGEVTGQLAKLYPAMDLLRMDGGMAKGVAGARSPRRHELLHAMREAQEAGKASGAAVKEQDHAQPPFRLRALDCASPLVTPIRKPAVSIPELVGESAVMQELARMIRLVAPTPAAVLIEGETGTGKEVVAKAIHRLSARAGKPFGILNCAAIPESLLEAELFGHTRGAFTGAVQSRTGRIEAANGGTLFLDEIGEMPLTLQPKMLRFLECGELQKVGENETLRVDVRVIAATHQPLEECVEEKAFRLDLYHRLAVFPLEVSPLRERLDDLPLLVEFFLQQMARQAGGLRRSVSMDALDKLRSYAWPGNVRELMHVLERGAILAEDRAVMGVEEICLRLARST